MTKIKVTNIATRDSIFAVVGERDTIAAYILNFPHKEYLTFEVIHPNGGLTKCNVLNIPREIVMIGSEHEVELDEQGQVKREQTDERVGRVSLG